MIEIRISAINAHRWRRNALLAIGLVLFLWLSYLVREIWLPLLIAFLIAMVLDPLADKMERRGWSRVKSAILIYVAFFVVTCSALALAIPAVVNQTTQLTKSIGDYLPSGESDTQTKRSLKKLLTRIHATPFVEGTVMHASSQISQGLNRSSAWLGDAAKGLVSNLLWVVIIPIVAFYALKDFHLIYARMLLFVPHEHRGFAQNLVNDITSIFVRYLRGMLIVCALNAAATAILLFCFKVPNAMGVGAIAGLLYMVPYIGPLVTYAVTAGACLTGGASFNTLLIVIALMAVLHSVIFDQIITPRIVGQHVGLHPVLSIIALLIGGVWLGIIGMILAVPTAAVIQMVLIVLFPKLAQPIEVPAGPQLHDRVDEIEHSNSRMAEAEVESAVDVHQTIVEAVDSADGDRLPKPEPPIGHEEVGAPAAASRAPTAGNPARKTA